ATARTDAMATTDNVTGFMTPPRHAGKAHDLRGPNGGQEQDVARHAAVPPRRPRPETPRGRPSCQLTQGQRPVHTVVAGPPPPRRGPLRSRIPACAARPGAGST